jgi:uncharacterized protein
MLGVAGGEFIIPILIFGFGVDIKTAGTASVLISVPIVLTGVMRHSLLAITARRVCCCISCCP